MGDSSGIERLSLGDVTRHAVTDRESWLKMRAVDLTASDVPSICGCGYRSIAEVWAEKRGLLQPQADNAMLRRGRWLEPAIWGAIKDTNPTWEIRGAKTYLRAPAARMGCTPDALAIDPTRDGFVLVQGKIVARPIFEQTWFDGEGGVTVPLGYQLQTLTEVMLAEAAFPGTKFYPVLAALSVGDWTADLHMIPVRRHPDAEQKILQTVKDFWAMVDAGIQPAIDPAKDHDFIRRLYPVDDGNTIDLTGDNELPEMMDQKKALGKQAEACKKQGDAIATEILAKMGNSSYALLAGGRKISAKRTVVAEAIRAGYEFRGIREVKVK